MVFDIVWERSWLASSTSHERDSVTPLMKLLNHVKDCLCSDVEESADLANAHHNIVELFERAIPQHDHTSTLMVRIHSVHSF